MMTEEERVAVLALGNVWNLMAPVIPDHHDRMQAMYDIHRLQHLIMAQATMRAESGIIRGPIQSADADQRA